MTALQGCGLFADPDVAARKLIEIADAAEAVQDGRIYIELINAAFLAAGGSTPGRAGACDCEGLAVPARERHLREVHRHGGRHCSREERDFPLRA